MSAATSLRIGEYEVAENGNGWAVLRHGTIEKGDNAGQPKVTTVGYYSDLEYSLRRVLRESASGKGATEARELVVAIERAYAGIKAAVGR